MPSITLAQSQLHGGDLLTVTGSGWQSSMTVTLALRPGNTIIAVPVDLGEIRTADDGSFNFTAGLPTSIAPGDWRVTATTRGRPIQIATQPIALLKFEPTQAVAVLSATASSGTAEAMPLEITVAPATVITYSEWRAEYFSNPALAGAPALTRNDTAIDFDWGSAPPDPQLTAGNFSVRWTRSLSFADGHYLISIRAGGGTRVYVDGVLLINAWQGGVNAATEEIILGAGDHDLQVEYYAADNAASMHFAIGPSAPESPSATPLTPTVSGAPTNTPATLNQTSPSDTPTAAGPPPPGPPIVPSNTPTHLPPPTTQPAPLPSATHVIPSATFAPPSNTPVPPTSTSIPTVTPLPSATSVPPTYAPPSTSTPLPTSTPMPTDTPVPPTPMPPTPVPPSPVVSTPVASTPIPSTDTPIPPLATAVPPTSTTNPPTDTPPPPPPTDTPAPTDTPRPTEAPKPTKVPKPTKTPKPHANSIVV